MHYPCLVTPLAITIFLCSLEAALSQSSPPHAPRLMQIATLDSLAYSSYTSVQIFQLLNWKANDKTIQEINSQQNRTFTAAHNQFSYLSINEIYEHFLNLKVAPLASLTVQAPSVTQYSNNIAIKPYTTSTQSSSTGNSSVSYNYDWRNILTTSVKNQGKCGACWAFAAAADLQASYMKQYSFSIDFSQQQLIDCSSSFGNTGCTGGMMNNAYQYIVNAGITLESYYRYQQTSRDCSYDPTVMPHYSIKGSKVLQGDCSALLGILKERPVSVVVSANPSFIFYQSGILNSCGDTINHAIQLVGAVRNGDQGYYIGKNSWGTYWGDKGFVLINSLMSGGNLCNVCSYPQYPI